MFKGNKIIIEKSTEFVPGHIFECGQVFRYKKINDDYEVVSMHHRAIVRVHKNNTFEIECDDVKYFANYFDLDKNYANIKSRLKGNPTLDAAMQFGSGIRILKQDLFETIISFIISANNNIPRIRKTLEVISREFGKNMSEYFAFPKQRDLAHATEEFFRTAGAGYRAKYLVETIKRLNDEYILGLQMATTVDARKSLMKLMGVGRKVADCILLFALSRFEVFPVDTWLDKVGQEYFGMQGYPRAEISKCLAIKFGNLAGFAQQYLFYYRREMSKKMEDEK